MRELELTTSGELRDEYRRLLREDWSRDSLRCASRLVRELLATASLSLSFPWDSVESDGEHVRVHVSPSTWNDLAGFSEKFFLGKKSPFHQFVATSSANAPELVRLAQEVASELNIQTIIYLNLDTVLVGATRFLRDCQSMLLLMAISELLPEMRQDLPIQQVEALLGGLRLHIAQVWNDDFPHQAFLVGALTSHLEIDDVAAEAFRFAFRASNADDHDYLTKAHAVWFTLRDAGRNDDARHFLLNLARSSPPEHLPEIEQMIEQEFAARSV